MELETLGKVIGVLLIFAVILVIRYFFGFEVAILILATYYILFKVNEA